MLPESPWELVDVGVELNLPNKITKAYIAEALGYGALEMIDTKYQTLSI